MMDKTKMAVAVFDKNADAYESKFMDVSAYHASLDIFCSHIIKPNAAILDIACGPGNITKYLLQWQPKFEVLGIDMSPRMIELATVNNPDARFNVMDCRDISSIKDKFDAVTCGFGLPYLKKEEAIILIADASKLLHAGGMLYLSTMEDDYSRSGMETSSKGESLFMHYHEASYLIAALKQNDFEVINMSRQAYTKDDGTTMTDLILCAQRKN